ncbi:MAG: 3-deoxy-manno-octulosonate cytidylyltransferase [Endomicrobiaceae bacterium]|jgi:3-deoxy-manno-octulosonate cytidylyltransferase (CMP-KDO synthetase)|nr:3-deoxy-manno-octulosonate cytidylyltransferase [Endomicrobiaceae bacterium]
MKTAVVIPARYASSRFPGKPLFVIKNKPLILHVADKVAKCKNVDCVAVATDDKRIFDVVKEAGYSVFMTPENLKSGTDRVAYVAQKYLKAIDVFINVQGDEPLIDAKLVEQMIDQFKTDKKIEYITAAYKMKPSDDVSNPNTVKVIFDKDMYAVYFSRLPIPYLRDKGKNKIDYYKHIGVYGYRKNFVIDFSKMKQTDLEKAESLEQLRALENGKKIKIVMSAKDLQDVNVFEDIAKVEKKL